MIATSPRMRILTSCGVRPRIATGRAVCARNWLLSTSDPPGFEHRKILGQDLVEPPHIAMLHRMDVVAVERSQRIKVALGCRVRLHGRPMGFRVSGLIGPHEKVIAVLRAASCLHAITFAFRAPASNGSMPAAGGRWTFRAARALGAERRTVWCITWTSSPPILRRTASSGEAGCARLTVAAALPSRARAGRILSTNREAPP
jgi:hypothetical protein